MYKKIFFGELTNPKNANLEDVKGRELVAFIPLIALVIILGVYPKPILKPIDNSVSQLVELMQLKAVEERTQAKIFKYNNISEAK